MRHSLLGPKAGAGCAMAVVLVGGLYAGGIMMHAEEQPPVKPAPFVYDSKGRRDPFSPFVRDGKLVTPQKGMASMSRPVLYGILWDPGGRSLAMINDAEVRVGDSVVGYDVVEIRKDAVVLSGDGELVVLQIEFDTPPSKDSHGARGR